MTTIKLYIGLNDKDTHKQRHSNIIFKDIIYECLFDYDYNAFSCQLIDGVYRHTDGTVVSENTFVITLCDNVIDYYKLQNLINTLKNELNQECIMVEQYYSNISFM